MEFGPELCTNYVEATSREWLETNGIGGYAAGTISGVHTRRYHGLLIAATRPPLGRIVLLSKFEETVFVEGTPYQLSTNAYPGTIYPDGHKYLKCFRLDPFPVWTYRLPGIELTKKVFMVRGQNSTVITWTAKPVGNARLPNVCLEMRPLVAFRDHHHISRVGDASTWQDTDTGVVIRRDDHPPLYLEHNAVAVTHTGHWYHDLEYAIEKERGFDFHEDLYQPCLLEFDLSTPVWIVASDQKLDVLEPAALEKREMKRRAALVAAARSSDTLTRRLAIAADQFVVDRGRGKTMIAGYPWFSDWGRDTMISLPGLALTTNRPDAARDLLLEFSRHISDGMIPNRFPDEGHTPDYNTVDATLWYFEAVRSYIEKTGDTVLLRDQLYERLLGILDHHISGTRFHIKMDTDGMLYAGEPGVQLTWMDAKIGDRVITPRSGKPVEIQALWYNALSIVSGWASVFGDTVNARKIRTIAEKCRSSFNEQFWNAEEQCLLDFIDDEYRDRSVRPNQVFAVSLHHSMLTAERARKVVDKVENELLTPVGLRTLSPRDPRYVAKYEGSPEQRDSAYHQGTVWAWLLGPFITAYRKTHSDDPRAEQLIEELRESMERHLDQACLGQISEIFDAEPPHWPRGAPAQAWSVAEVLRVLRR